MADTDGNNHNAQIISEFRANHGNVASFAGHVMILLHHRGRTTGTERVTPLVCQPLKLGWAVFASAGGAPAHPSWYLNLVTHPQTTVEVGDKTVDVIARVARGAERDQIWTEQERRTPSVAKLEAKAAPRQIPVVILEPLS